MDTKTSNKYNDSFEKDISDNSHDIFNKLLLSKKKIQRKSKAVTFTASLLPLADLTDQERPQSSLLTPEKTKQQLTTVGVEILLQKKEAATRNSITQKDNNRIERAENKILLGMDQSISATIKGGRSVAHDKSDILDDEEMLDEEMLDEEILEEEILNSTGKNLIPRSPEVDDILSYVPNWMILWGNTVILLILCGLLFMSYHIKYPDVVSGIVTINSSYPPIPLVAKATGLVTLFKEDKATVLVDEPIGFIKNTADYEDVLHLKNILKDFQNKLNKGSSFSFYELPNGLQLGELQSTYNQLYLKIKEQKIQHHVNQNNTTRKGNIDQQLAELTAIKKAKEKSLSIKYQEYLKAKNLVKIRYEMLYKSGSISAEQLNIRESEVSNLLDIYQNDRMSFNEIKKRILDLNSNKVELDFIKEDQSILSQSSLVVAFEQMNTAIHNWEKKYVLAAPVSGSLNFIRFIKNNMYLQQATPLANIIPTIEMGADTTMIGELVISSIGSGKAEIGQEVNIALNDYPKKQYGIVLGKVESISNMNMPIPGGNGMVGYKVIVSFPRGLENTLKKDIQFKYNMQGHAEIITDDIRLIERFFHELRDLVGAK